VARHTNCSTCRVSNRSSSPTLQKVRNCSRHRIGLGQSFHKGITLLAARSTFMLRQPSSQFVSSFAVGTRVAPCGTHLFSCCSGNILSRSEIDWACCKSPLGNRISPLLTNLSFVSHPLAQGSPIPRLPRKPDWANDPLNWPDKEPVVQYEALMCTSSWRSRSQSAE